LPHQYSLYETAAVDDSIRELIRGPDFGGASVTIPHKLAIMSELAQLTPAAKMIGAVNTIIPIPVTGPDGEPKIVLTGDNTDWIGIKNAILAKTTEIPLLVQTHNGSSSKDDECGVVIGAGGTARAAIFALHELGLGTIHIWNRTRSTAEALAKDFPANYNVVVLDSLDALIARPPSIVVGTVPAHAIVQGKEDRQNEGFKQGLELSEVLFSRKEGGVVVEMAYRPRVTPLLELVQKFTASDSTSNTGAPPGPKSKWTIVYGVDVLLEQGYQQFELWTHRRAPKRMIKERVMVIYERM
jgi:pentafunctional AROM polypeptide